MTCGNCGYKTHSYYCHICRQSAVEILAITPNGITVPPIDDSAQVLKLTPGLIAILASGRAWLQWYDGEYTHAIRVVHESERNP